jgi:hypothetical protein
MQIFGLSRRSWAVYSSDVAFEFCAYIDPGSGSLILQMLLGAALAVSFAIRGFWSRVTGTIRALFGRHASKKDESGSDPKH